MEFFLPSVLILLLAAAVVFFVLPRFGPFVLAIVSAILLAFGLYQHRYYFASEYRMSTWQQGLMSFSPYVMVGGLLVVIAVYGLYLMPASKGANTNAVPAISMPNMPTVGNMPPANTATNSVTSSINKALTGVANNVKKNNAVGNLLGGINKAVNRVNSLPLSQV